MKVFTEEQRFNQWYIHLLFVVEIFIGVYFVFSGWSGDKTNNMVSIGALVLVLAIHFLMYNMKLITRIDEFGVHYQFKPFIKRRTIKWEEIEKIYVRTYDPITEYGGWGIRFTFGKKGKAYNVSGYKGIQIELKNKKPILIGTCKERDAELILKNYKND